MNGKTANAAMSFILLIALSVGFLFLFSSSAQGVGIYTVNTSSPISSGCTTTYTTMTYYVTEEARSTFDPTPFFLTFLFLGAILGLTISQFKNADRKRGNEA